MHKRKNISNIIVSTFSQIILLAFGFVVPRIILTRYGSDTNGLISTITQIFTYVALLEAGIGQATKNALYPYINGEMLDKDNISRVLSASKRYYRKTTYIYASVVFLLAIILPLVIKTNVSNITVFWVVLFEGLTGCVSFYFIQSWSMLLSADGKSYIVNNIDLLSRTLCYIIKIVLACLSVNIAYIQLGYFVVSLFKLVIYKRYIANNYGWINSEIKTDSLILKDRNAYVISEIAWTVFSSTDMIILSVFCSTSESSVYSVYNMVFIAENALLNAIYQALLFNLGQTYHDNIAKYKELHDLFNSIFVGAITILMSTTYLMMIPFISLYTRGVHDIEYINYSLPVLFCLVQMLSWSRYIAGNLSGLAGYAKKVSYVSLIEAITNIFFSLLLVRRYGIVGVLFATVIALPIKVLYLNWLSERVILKRRPFFLIKLLAMNYLLFTLVVLVGKTINMEISSYLMFFGYGAVVFLIISLLGIGINVFINPSLIRVLSKFARPK